jgi:hypothetical protein
MPNGLLGHAVAEQDASKETFAYIVAPWLRQQGGVCGAGSGRNLDFPKSFKEGIDRIGLSMVKY